MTTVRVIPTSRWNPATISIPGHGSVTRTGQGETAVEVTTEQANYLLRNFMAKADAPEQVDSGPAGEGPIVMAPASGKEGSEPVPTQRVDINPADNPPVRVPRTPDEVYPVPLPQASDGTELPQVIHGGNIGSTPQVIEGNPVDVSATGVPISDVPAESLNAALEEGVHIPEAGYISAAGPISEIAETPLNEMEERPSDTLDEIHPTALKEPSEANIDAVPPEGDEESPQLTEQQAQLVNFYETASYEEIEAVKGIGQGTVQELINARPLTWEKVDGILSQRQLDNTVSHLK